MNSAEPPGEPIEILLLPDRKGYRLIAPAYSEAARQARSELSSEPPEKETGRLARWGRTVRLAYGRVARKRVPREALLRGLTEDALLKVRYPADLTVDEAETVFQDLMESYRKKHRRWLIVNGALLPLGAVLTLIPGPNVFAGYLAWRAYSHHRAGKGTRAALAAEDVRFEADGNLERLRGVRRAWFLPGRRRRTRRLGSTLGVPDLDRQY